MLNNTKFAREAERERGRRGGTVFPPRSGSCKKGQYMGPTGGVNFGLDADTSGKEEGRLAQKKWPKARSR